MNVHLRNYQRNYAHFSLPLQFRNKCLDLTVKTTCDVDELPKKQGCYLLICGNYVLYVGQSKNLKQRWANHHIHKQNFKELITYSKLADFFRLEYYLTDTHIGCVRKELEKFLKDYYKPILCGHSGNREYIFSIMNYDIYDGSFGSILDWCTSYYEDRIKKDDWQNRCAKFYNGYSQLFGTFESCQEQISYQSKKYSLKCVDISPFFPSAKHPDHGVIYTKFGLLKD